MEKIIIPFVLALLVGCSIRDKSSQPDHSSRITTQSNNLEESVIKSWGRQRDFFIERNFEIIEWEVAKTKLLEGNVTGGKQYHTGWLTIYTSDGKQYLTKQPKMDALWEFMEEKKLKIEGFGIE